MACVEEKDTSDPNLTECRICKDIEMQEEMISPCSCAGSLGKVHKHCLLTWVQTSGLAVNCNICKSRYTCSIVIRRRNFWWFLNQEFNYLLSFAGVLMFFTLVLLLTLCSSFFVLNRLYRFHKHVCPQKLMTQQEVNGQQRYVQRVRRPMNATDVLFAKVLISAIIAFPIVFIWTVFVREVGTEWSKYYEYAIEE